MEKLTTNEKKYSPNMTYEERKEIPDSVLKQVYDKNDLVLFGNSYVKGKISYNYIPAELMTTGRPFILHTSISYDGKGNADLPASAEIVEYEELAARFIDNKFE